MKEYITRTPPVNNVVTAPLARLLERQGIPYRVELSDSKGRFIFRLKGRERHISFTGASLPCSLSLPHKLRRYLKEAAR